MSTIKQLKEMLEEESALKLVTEAYSEVAGTKLKKIRVDIEQTRVFFGEISKVLSQIKKVAKINGIELEEKKKETAYILITSNYRFYGSLENNLIEYFLENTNTDSSARFLIGKTAADFFSRANGLPSDHHTIFSTDVPTYEELKVLITAIQPYKKIVVFYPRFRSVLIQIPTKLDITQTPSDDSEDPSPSFSFIFEPELDRILKFFDNQIISVLLQQVFLEAELARTGARLISMEEAQSKADRSISDQTLVLRQAVRSLKNSYLLETISALSNWRKVSDRV